MSSLDEKIARTYQRVVQAEQEFHARQEEERRRREERVCERLLNWARTEAKIESVFLEQAKICRVDGHLALTIMVAEGYAVTFNQARSALVQYELLAEGDIPNLKVIDELYFVTNMPDLFSLRLTITEVIEYLIGRYRYEVDRSSLNKLLS